MNSRNRGVSLSAKILKVFSVLVIVSLQIHTPVYADQAQDKSLYLAIRKGEFDAAKRLIEGGAKVDAVDSMGDQPIHNAANKGAVEFVKFLLAAGAKVDAVGGAGYQPIHIAAQQGNIELVQALLAAGAKVDARIDPSNKFAGEPIHFAVQSGNADLVKMLLAAGAKPEAKDNKDKPPFSWIAGKGDPEQMKKVLLAAGAKEVPTKMDKRKQMKPVWMTSACYRLNFAINDKLDINPTYRTKYIVRFAESEVYFAEKTARVGDSSSREVSFPDDFHEQRTNRQSTAVCANDRKYTWEIYADDILVDSGTFEFIRNRKTKSVNE